MDDIALAIALIGVLSLALFLVTMRLLKARSKHFLDAMAVVVVGLIITYVYTVWGQLWIVNYIPLPSVIVLSNWFPLLLSVLAAIVWLRLEPSSLWRRLPVIVLLVLVSVYSLTRFIPAAPPECGDDWTLPSLMVPFPVCLQTTPHTCSAAAAATLLNTIGIRSSEQEMARLCLTRSGTTWLGLYHGLSSKLQGTSRRVEFFECTVQTVEKMAMVHPVLLCCRLDPEIAHIVPEYVSLGGWIPGTAHSVVYFGRVNGMHMIGDPSRGYEAWGTRDLNTLWTGTGLRFLHDDKQGNPIP